MAAASGLWWRADGTNAGHPPVAAVKTNLVMVPLGAGQQISPLVEQGESLQMAAPPRRLQLREVPLAVCRAGQPLVPDRIGVVEDAVEERSFGDDERHETDDCTAANSSCRRVYKTS